MAKADHVTLRQHRPGRSASASSAPSPGAHGGRDRGRLAQSRGTAHDCDGRGVRLRLSRASEFDQARVQPEVRHVDHRDLSGKVHVVPTRATDTAADAAQIILKMALRSGDGVTSPGRPRRGGRSAETITP
jgi:hypothetical protein